MSVLCKNIRLTFRLQVYNKYLKVFIFFGKLANSISVWLFDKIIKGVMAETVRNNEKEPTSLTLEYFQKQSKTFISHFSENERSFRDAGTR